jgi:formate C-acetyltransferase
MEGVTANPGELSRSSAWRSFAPGHWQTAIEVRDFITRNVDPYQGDEAFLVDPSPRTKVVWDKLQPYFDAERQKGVLDVDAATPSAILAHAPVGLIATMR